MEAIPLEVDRYGRRRTSFFIAILHSDINEHDAQQQAIGLYAFNVAYPEDLQLATVLFCLKKYDSEVRLTIYANDLNFQTGAEEGDIPMI